jgi:hypothetical protein
VAVSSKFFTKITESPSRFVQNVDQQRSREVSPFLASPAEETSYHLPPKEKVVPPVVDETVTAVSDHIIDFVMMDI